MRRGNHTQPQWGPSACFDTRLFRKAVEVAVGELLQWSAATDAICIKENMV